jgi:cyclic pyranopterin phosphate synthase
MPETDYVWLPREDLLSFEEIDRVVRVFTRLGVNKVRITGGEPLLRRDVTSLVGLLTANEALTERAVTTNGILLQSQAKALREAGLSRITVSLDTIRRDRFREFMRRDRLRDVLAGIDAARSVGFGAIKLDTVIVRGRNEDEIVDLIEFAQSIDGEVRFIEYMDVGGATRWTKRDVVSKKEVLATIEAHFGVNVEPIDTESWAPAKRYRLPSGNTFGIIASTTEPFCATCDRSRLTADGLFYLCLYARKGLDLRAPLRTGATDDDLLELIRGTWEARDDRGAEHRLELEHRGALVKPKSLRKDPHLEMHTRGG